MTLRWVPGWNGLTEPEAVSYVAAVEAADGQELEFGVAKAINDFVLGCKNDGIWDAIKASCILAGARTLSGALVPLVGTAPTNNNFVAGDYNRETGLQGNGTDNYLNSNRATNADPQNNAHISISISSLGNESTFYMGAVGSDGRSVISRPTATAQGDLILQTRGVSDNIPRVFGGTATGFLGASRSDGSNMSRRFGGSSSTVAYASTAVDSTQTVIFAGNFQGTIAGYSNARISFYSIGESLNLAALDTRVSALITAIGAAIP